MNLKWLNRHRWLVVRVFLASFTPSIVFLALSYYQTITQAKVKLEAASQQSAYQVSSLVRAAEITLKELEVYLKNADAANPNNWKLLQRIAYNDPRYREIGVVNKKGELTLTSLGPVNPPIQMDSKFRADLSRKELQIIGPLTTSIMQERSIVLVLPTQGKGELNILVDPVVLNTYWSNFNELDIGSDGYTAYFNQSTQQVIASTGLLPKDKELFTNTASREEIKIIQPVAGTDLIITSTVSRRWILRNWRNLFFVVVPVSFLSSFLVAALFIRLIYLNHFINHDIKIGLKKSEFVLHYQPIFDLRTGSCIGCEALIRWQHSSRGLLLPSRFIPIAEQSGSITELGAWVVQQALFDQKEILEKYSNLYISVNLSPVQINSKASIQKILCFLEKRQDLLGRLILEITETVLIEAHQANTINAIASLRALGTRVALDDFGTGHCGINYLSQLNFDYLKIDQKFIAASDSTSTIASILDGIVDLGKHLKVDLIAEGIETEAQKQALLRKGIRYGQGRLLAPPMPVKEFEQFLNTRHLLSVNTSEKTES